MSYRYIFDYNNKNREISGKSKNIWILINILSNNSWGKEGTTQMK